MLPPCETPASRVSDRHPGVDGLLCLSGSGIISSQTTSEFMAHLKTIVHSSKSFTGDGWVT